MHYKLMFMIIFLITTSYFPSQAEEPAIPIDPDCTDSLEVCQQRALKQEKLRQQCAHDPAWCEQRRNRLRQTREERQLIKKECQDHPEQCETLKKKFKEKQAKARKMAQQDWCQNNPQRCAQWEVEMKNIKAQCKALRRQLDEKYLDRP